MDCERDRQRLLSAANDQVEAGFVAEMGDLVAERTGAWP